MFLKDAWRVQEKNGAHTSQASFRPGDCSIKIDGALIMLPDFCISYYRFTFDTNDTFQRLHSALILRNA
jgi:hypothetical protein